MGASDLKPLKELNLTVSRWGNSLAVRLPAEFARQLGVGEGDALSVTRESDNSYKLSAKTAKKPFDKAAWMAQARAHLASMPRTPSVIKEVRENARY